MESKTWQIPSKSREGQEHTVSFNGQDWNCNCEAMIYSGDPDYVCKHIKKIRAEQTEEQKPVVETPRHQAKLLSLPFPIEEIKHRPLTSWEEQSGPMGYVANYIDARAVFDRLDGVVGAENWQTDFKEVDGKLMAGIGIKAKYDWVWKWDTGSESTMEKDKGHVSDSIKRAAVQWGIGRFLYAIPEQKVRGFKTKAGKFKFKDESLAKYRQWLDDYLSKK